MGRSLWSIADSVITRVTKWFANMAAVAAGIILLLSVADVVGAKLFQVGIPSAIEFISALNVLLIFGALAFVELERGHIRMEELYSRLSKGFSHALKLAAYVIEALVCAFFSWRTIFLIQEMVTNLERNPGTVRFPLWPFALIVCLGFALLAIASIVAFGREVAPYQKLKLESSTTSNPDKPEPK